MNRTPPIDTLVIIGNGFDIWQGLDTGYAQFQSYYLAHRDEILKKLHIKMHTFISPDGNETQCSDVELIYGDPFEPGELDKSFWSTFEASLDKIDTERINLFFGKQKKGLKAMEKSIRNANRILKKAFCDWIATIELEQRDAGYRFGENCLFINFNYTDTLVKRFFVDETKEFHIHGEATDSGSIIFGHASHPQEPEYMLARLGGRFLGLFYVDKILYETDKHCQDNIQMLCMFLAMRTVMCEEVKHIYVLGHSMGPADIEYFDFLVRSTQIPQSSQDFVQETRMQMDPMEDLYNRIQYVVEAVGYQNGDVQEKYSDAMCRKLAQEQEERNVMFQQEFMRMLHKQSIGGIGEECPKLITRREDAKWHISYHSQKDKEWIDVLMRRLGCTNYELCHDIEGCIEEFKIH